MIVGVLKETRSDETRVAATPDSVKKLVKRGLSVRMSAWREIARTFRTKPTPPRVQSWSIHRQPWLPKSSSK